MNGDIIKLEKITTSSHYDTVNNCLVEKNWSILNFLLHRKGF